MSNANDRYTKDTETRFTLRISTELLDKIKEEAQKTKRSAAKQIEFILEQYFENKPE